MKIALFLGFGVLCWVHGAPGHIQTLKYRKSVHFQVRYAFLKVPRLTKRADQFCAALLCRRGAQSQSPSNQSIDKILLRDSEGTKTEGNSGRHIFFS